ncbi:hypothetical protein GCM10009839_57890 [Catenulispora yoronensis]|uniref:Uncharacterized protein n=1 Tax=Catenulispora yoronensis TaxID=450799 RepID=A0ABN2V178_9ACTN
MNGSTSHSGYEEVHATVVVEGGPPGLAHAADSATFGGGERVKVPYLGGYEHYERVEEADGPGPLVYRWLYRTAVAE